MSEREFRTVYNDCRRRVGEEYNHAFVPHAFSTFLAENFHLPAETFLPSFELNEPVALYPDAVDFLLKLKKDSSIDPLIFTQGEVFDHGWQDGIHLCGFQNHKVWASGIPTFLGKDAIDRTNTLGFPFVYGSFDKVNFDTLQPILEYAQATGRMVQCFDDCLDNLDMLHGFFTDYQRHIELNWIVRHGEHIQGSAIPINYIRSFDDVDVRTLSGSLTLIDFDGTLSIREHMSEKLYRNVWAQAEKLLSGTG